MCVCMGKYAAFTIISLNVRSGDDDVRRLGDGGGGLVCWSRLIMPL